MVSASEAESPAALLLAERLRDAHPAWRVVTLCGGGSLKSQMKRADRTGAAIALILGEDEVASGTVSAKPMRGQGEQQRIALTDLSAKLATLLTA